MAVFAVNELSGAPVSPIQWQWYFNIADDNLYLQVLAPTSAVQVQIETVGNNGAVRSLGLVTLTMVSAHGLVVGDKITVADVQDASFDGVFFVESVPTTVTLTYSQAGADTTSGSNGPPAATLTPVYPEWQVVTTGTEVRDSVRPTDTLVRARYVGRDYNTFLDEGLAWLRENYGDKFDDFVASDFGIMFAKYVSAALDTLSWYMDKEVTEWFYPLMRLRSRAELLSRMSAYKPRSATACTVDLDLALPNGPYSFNVMVPEGFQFTGPNSLVFELLADVTFSAGETTKTGASAVQGRTIQEDFTSDGSANQAFRLDSLEDDEFVASGYVEFFVSGVQWTEEDFLPYARENKIEVIYGATPPTIITGDGVIGNIPQQGASIVARYIATKGKIGKAAVAGTIQSSASSLVVNLTEITVTANNPAGASGGDDPETLNEIKTNAPAYFKTADRGVTRQDITTLADTYSDGVFGTVAKAKANIVRGIADDLVMQSKLQALQGLADDLDSYLDEITAQVGNIATARGNCTTQTSEITTQIAALDASVVSAGNELVAGKTALTNMPYQQLFDRGTGAATLFGITLQKIPVFTGSLLVWVDNLVVTAGGTGVDGDADTVVGWLDSAAVTFSATWVGRLIKIGTDVRVIRAVHVGDNRVQYSGSNIVGTGLFIEVYDPVVYGMDDGAGAFTGFGISPGTINYTSGAVQFITSNAVALDKDIFCQYGYADGTVTAFLDNAISDLGDISTYSGAASTASGVINTELADVAVAETAIEAQITLSLVIPASMTTAIDDLEAYLDENLSGECKANIVIVQVLVVDENGFYIAPSQTLLTAVKDFLDGHAVVPTTIATVSGYYNIIAVDMTYRLKISTSYKFDEVSVRLLTTIDNQFKGRDYGESLFRSDYYNRAVPDQSGSGGIAGVAYADITITGTAFPDPANQGTAPLVNSFGNLIVPDTMILTKGTITIEEITG